MYLFLLSSTSRKLEFNLAITRETLALKLKRQSTINIIIEIITILLFITNLKIIEIIRIIAKRVIAIAKIVAIVIEIVIIKIVKIIIITLIIILIRIKIIISRSKTLLSRRYLSLEPLVL